MLGLYSGQVLLVSYESDWAKLFVEEREQLQASLGAKVLDIQHIGSTSIPGIPAKPILDIGIAVANFEEAARCIEPMKELGYSYKGENGIPRRHYFVKGSPRTHHLHMLELQSPAWKEHLFFRDYLIAHPDLAQEYADLKQTLARQCEADREKYQAGKADFIKSVLQNMNNANFKRDFV